MTDLEAINFLRDKLGHYHSVALALGVTDQVLFHWRQEERGIPAGKRAAVWAMVNDNGGNLTREWLFQRTPAKADPPANSAAA